MKCQCGFYNNKPITSFCSRCGEILPTKVKWPQESCNQMRTGSLIPGMGNPNFGQQTAWNPGTLNGQLRGLLPSLVATEDILVYYNPTNRTIESRNICKGDTRFGQILWRSEMVADLTFTNSPVIYGSLIYLITNNPMNLLQRISMVSGRRQVCKVVLGSSFSREIPGALFDDSPPLLYENSHLTNQGLLIVLTTKGVCILELSPLHRNPEPIVKGIFFENSWDRYDWSRPVAVDTYIMATSRNQAEILCIDLEDYPRIDTTIFRYDQEVYRRNSPCICIQVKDKDEYACWFTSDDNAQKSRIVYINPLGGIIYEDVRYSGNVDQQKAFGPVTNGQTVFIPSLADDGHSMGVTYYAHGTGNPVFVNLPRPGITPYFNALCNGCLVDPNGNQLRLLDTSAAQPSFVGKVFAPNANNVLCNSRPIIVDSQVFVQCNDLVGCLEVSR